MVHSACPKAEETMKWSFPHFMHEGMLCSMASFKAHCAFGFWKGSLILDANGRSTEAMGQFGRITSLGELPSRRVLTGYIKKAMELNEQGIKSPNRIKRAPKPEAKVPKDLAVALGKNKKARATFDNFTPSHRREYVEWITEAKSEATRQRRLETAIGWMAENKSRNWKYING
jgi:uncharacterized protein YdeI (YjbR/CyaY-like superfamily)